MSELSTLLQSMRAAAHEIWTSLVSQAPSLLAALLILIVGWLIARVIRSGMQRLTSAANRLLDRLFRTGPLASVRLSQAATAVLGQLSFWLVIFYAAMLALRTAGLSTLGWVAQLGAFLPNLLIGAGIIVVGYILSEVIGQQVVTTARAAKAANSRLLGTLAQAAVFVTTLVVGLDQIGVDVTFLVALFAITLGAACGGIMIAFGLGARDHVSNLLGARSARRTLQIGQNVRIGEIQGNLLDISQTHIAVETASGRTLLPGRLIELENVELMTAPAPGEQHDG